MGSLIELENCADYLNIQCNTVTALNGFIGPIAGSDIIGTPDISLNAPSGQIALTSEGVVRILSSTTNNQLQINAKSGTAQSTGTLSFYSNNSNAQNYVFWGANNGSGGGLSDGHFQLFSYSNSFPGGTQILDIYPPTTGSGTATVFYGDLNIISYPDTLYNNTPYLALKPFGYTNYSIGAAYDNKLHFTLNNTFSASDLFMMDSVGNIQIKGDIIGTPDINLSTPSGYVNVSTNNMIISNPNGAVTQLTLQNNLSAGTTFVLSSSSDKPNFIQFNPTGGQNYFIGTAGSTDNNFHISNTYSFTTTDIFMLDSTGTLTISNNLIAKKLNLNISVSASASMGTGVLLDIHGEATIFTTAITTSSIVFLSYQNSAATTAGISPLVCGAIVGNVSFDIYGGAGETVNWLIIN